MDNLIQNKKELRKKASVTTPDECKKIAVYERLKDVLGTLKTTYGLTAPQIGIELRAGIFKYERIELFMINPTILAKSIPTMFMGESCVSFSGLVNTLRFKELTIQWMDLGGVTRSAVLFGKEAFAFQHLVDHLDGILFIDKVYRKKPIVRKEAKIGRNDKCSCGSGKKYKKCCL